MQAAKDGLNGAGTGGGALHIVAAAAVEAFLPGRASDWVLATPNLAPHQTPSHIGLNERRAHG